MCVCVCVAGLKLATSRGVPGVVSARPAVVVRDRAVGRGAHGRRDRRRSRRRRGLDRSQVPASARRPLPGRRVGQPAAASVLRVPADRLGPDAIPAARLGPADDGRPVLGHQFHGRRSHVPAQVPSQSLPTGVVQFVSRFASRPSAGVLNRWSMGVHRRSLGSPRRSCEFFFK